MLCAGRKRGKRIVMRRKAGKMNRKEILWQDKEFESNIRILKNFKIEGMAGSNVQWRKITVKRLHNGGAKRRDREVS